MKRLIVILGPNGVGKSTVSKSLLSQLANSAYVDSDSLRTVNASGNANEIINIQKANIIAVMKNYFSAGFIDNVIFPYGLHGHRKNMLNEIIFALQSDFKLEVITVILVCSEEENIRRMQSDGRDSERIKRALSNTRAIYEGMSGLKFDTTFLTPEQTAQAIILHLNGGTNDKD